VLELDSEVVTLLESDAIVLVGTVDTEGLPDATRGWGVRVIAGDAPQFRCFLATASDRAQYNLRTTGRIALTVTDAQTLKSVQVKGRAVRMEDCTEDDRAEAARFFDALAAIIEATNGTPYELMTGMHPGPLNAVIATIDECYDQTPGPTAGAPA
jgi:Pyridoxamine 5'-phosphate oxidase